MVKQILTFSRRSGQELAVLDLLKALNSTVELLRATIPTTVEILCGFGEEPLRIKADRTQLQQVVINLCTNAVHAMDEKGLLRIDLKKTDAAPLPNIVDPASTIGYARLSISDTGIGMNQETLGRIFEPFFTTKEVGKGTGMGLAVAHGIVEQHGGVITVESTPGKGSAFHIYFPLCDEQETEDLDAASALPSGKGESILLVDDEESLVKTSCELLTELGYRVRGTTSSLEALEIFRADPEAFDLVFSDQTMPKLSGVDLAIELLKIKPQTPIILITGYTSKVTEQDAKALGIRAFCEKPLSNQELAELIRKVLD